MILVLDSEPKKPDQAPNTRINPDLSDYDGDGLNNQRERELGTLPVDPDTDNDGFNDGVEVAAGTNPRDSSSHP